MIGFYPPGDLVEPQPLAVPVKTEQDAMPTAANNNPQVVAALFNDAAAKDAVDVAFGAAHAAGQLAGPDVRAEQLTAAAQREPNGYQAVVQLSVPIYQGGAEYSAVRQARQTGAADDTSWWTMPAAPRCRMRCRPGRR